MLGCYVSRVTRHAVCCVVTLFKCGHRPTGRDDNAPRLITSHIVHINISFSCLMVLLNLKIVSRSTVSKQQSDLNPEQCCAQLPSVPKLCSHVGSLSGSWGLVTSDLSWKETKVHKVFCGVFFWLKAPSRTFTFKTVLTHDAKRALTH